MKRALKVGVGSLASALDRFEKVWSKAARGEKIPAEHVLTFVNLQLLLRTLTPARWTLLERLRADGPLSVNELARRLGRDYKNVHGDVKRLAPLADETSFAQARLADGVVTWPNGAEIAPDAMYDEVLARQHASA